MTWQIVEDWHDGDGFRFVNRPTDAHCAYRQYHSLVRQMRRRGYREVWQGSVNAQGSACTLQDGGSICTLALGYNR